MHSTEHRQQRHPAAAAAERESPQASLDLQEVGLVLALALDLLFLFLAVPRFIRDPGADFIQSTKPTREELLDAVDAGKITWEVAKMALDATNMTPGEKELLGTLDALYTAMMQMDDAKMKMNDAKMICDDATMKIGVFYLCVLKEIDINSKALDDSFEKTALEKEIKSKVADLFHSYGKEYGFRMFKTYGKEYDEFVVKTHAEKTTLEKELKENFDAACKVHLDATDAVDDAIAAAKVITDTVA
jgi:hypothetical protein